MIQQFSAPVLLPTAPPTMVEEMADLGTVLYDTTVIHLLVWVLGFRVL